MNLSMNDRKKAVLLTTALLVIAVLCVVRIYVVSHSSVENGQALYADLYQNGVHQGFISTSLLPITCLPNRLVIRVREEVSVPDDTAPVPDGVTY